MPEQGHCRGCRVRLVEVREVTAGDRAQLCQRVADGIPVAAERTDDIREDGSVIGTRDAVLGAGRHHQPGKPAQIAPFRGRQFGSGVVCGPHRTSPRVRPHGV
jgi:hypothetical protein